MSRQDRAIEWLREHPMFIVGFLAAALFAALLLGYIATVLSEMPSVPFIYNL